MNESQNAESVLVSELSVDEDMVELVEMFVDELPDRVSQLEAALSSQDYESLTRSAHQLKGAAGGYGFPRITEAAKRLEETSRTEQDLEKLTSEVREIANLCSRARATQPES